MINSILTCLIFGLLGIRLAPSLGLLDIPGGRRQHGCAVPKVGGIAIMATLVIHYAFFGVKFKTNTLESLAILSMALLGIVDDRFDLRARYKAGLGFLLALVLGLATTLEVLPGLGSFQVLSFTIPALPWLVFLLLAFMYLCIPQALNLIDGANGLAIGFALVVVFSLWLAGDPHPVVGGALLACLTLNWPKARLFLGDAGSLSIGLLLVVFARKVILLPKPDHMIWLFAYPAVDVITVTIIRLLKKRPIFMGDRNHLHFQLSDRWPRLKFLAVPVLLLFAALCSSEIYVKGAWSMLPYFGLVPLCVVAIGCIAAGISKVSDKPTPILPPETEILVPKAALEQHVK